MDWSAVTILVCIDVVMATSLFLPLVTDVFFLMPIGAMAVSSYAFGYLNQKMSAVWLVAVIAVVAGGLIASVGGAFVIRMRGFAAAIATLAMVEIIQNFFVGFKPTGGAEGLTGVPLVSTFSIVLSVTLVALAAVGVWYFSPLGIKARATGDDEVAAESAGINTRSLRLSIYAASGLLGGLGGVLSAGYTGYVSPDQFGFAALNNYLIPAIFGGLGSPVGPVVGGAVTTGIPQFVVSLQQYSLLISSVVLLLLIVLRRGGLIKRSRAAEHLMAFRWRRSQGTGAGDAVPAAFDGAALQVVSVSKKFSGVAAVADASFDVRKGEVLAIIGPNGAGKTTLLNILSGVETADAGRIEVDGRPARVAPAHRAARLGIARTFQNLRLFRELLVGDNVAAGATFRTAKEAAARVGVDRIAAERVASLPYGLQRRVEFARAIATRPRLLLLDEPTAGMTAKESDEVSLLLQGLRGQGLTIILVEHNLRFIMGLVDRVLVLDSGQVIAIGEPHEVQHDPNVRAAYFGIAEGADDATSVLRDPKQATIPVRGAKPLA